MNIIYKLTNKSKTDFPNTYIGSKKNCRLEEIDSVPTIVYLSNGKPYYSSSTCSIFLKDLQDGHEFHAEIMEEITDPDLTLVREYEILKELNVAHNPQYYNKSNGIPRHGSINTSARFDLINKYGETVGDYNGSQTAMARRDKTAKSLGFDNFSELSFDIYEKNKAGITLRQITRDFGKTDSHFAQKFICIFDLDKAVLDVTKSEYKDKVRDLYTKERVSIRKISEILDIDQVAARYFLSSLADKDTHSTLYRRINKTEDELVKHVMDSIASGKTSTDVCNELGSTSLIVNRYIAKGIVNLYKKYNIEIGQETATFIRNGNRINEVLSEES